MARFLMLQNVTKGYPKSPQPILIDLDLEIKRGERLVILGHSGAGKTTLLGLLGLILRADEGQVLVDGEDAQQWSEKKRALWRNRSLGYVFQDFGLIPELNLEDNVNLPLRIAQVPRNQWQGRELLNKVGLEGRERAYPKELSGGEVQRVAIARALVGSPQLVLADEPTGNLQRTQGEQIGNLFLKLQQELGFSLVVATHNERLVHLLRAQPLWLYDGKLHLNRNREEAVCGED